MATAADVPNKFDVVLNGQGYILANAVDHSLPFRVQRAAYSFSKTFVERQNVSGAYGDDQQAFWLTASQNDWSLGEDQKFFHSADQDSVRRFWRGSQVNVLTPGQVAMRAQAAVATLAAAAKAVCSYLVNCYVATTTNLYAVDRVSFVTDEGAHGLGAAPATFGLVADGAHWYLSTTAAGTVGVRRWDSVAGAGHFTTFSATGADSLEFLNNSLYGYRNASGDFGRYDTAGVFTSLFTWKSANGTALSFAASGGETGVLRAFGSKLLILRPVSPGGSELWLYDGTNTTLVAKFPNNFVAYNVRVVQGIAFVGGYMQSADQFSPAVYYYASGNVGKLWQSLNSTTAAATATTDVVDYDGGLVFNDDSGSTGMLKFYNLANGGIHSASAYTVAGDTPLLAGCQLFVLHTRNQTNAYIYPPATINNASLVQTSLFGFDSSLTKVMRGIAVDFAAATDGNGGTVDIAYQVDSVTGSWTTLQTGAVSGTEYTFPPTVTGRSLAVQVTLNKGTSTAGPILKRIYARAAPLLQRYRMCNYLLDCSGRDGKRMVMLRDNSEHPLDGLQQATNLAAAAAMTAPITITDRFGTFTGIIEADTLEFDEVRPEEFVTRLQVREV